MCDIDNIDRKVENSFDVLTLGFSGVEGFSILGALLNLDNLGYLDNIKYYSGSSTSSIICFLLVIGYKIIDIFSISSKNNILFGMKDFKTPEELNYCDEYEDVLEDVLNKALIKKFGKTMANDMTLEELFEYTDLEMSLISQKDHCEVPIIINHLTYPSLNCVSAVLLACNLSPLSSKISYNGLKYNDCYYLNPFPINIYDNGKNRILGVYSNYLYKKLNNVNFFHNLTNMYGSLACESKKIIINNASKMCYNIEIKVDHNLMINQKTKYKMYLDGFYKCEIYVSKKTLKNI